MNLAQTRAHCADRVQSKYDRESCPSCSSADSAMLHLVLTCREKMKIPANVVDELVKGANSDIRQVLNMLSTFKLSKSDMDFDEGKQLSVYAQIHI